MRTGVHHSGFQGGLHKIFRQFFSDDFQANVRRFLLVKWELPLGKSLRDQQINTILGNRGPNYKKERKTALEFIIFKYYMV